MNTIRHTGLVVTNLNQSLLFWTKYLKFKIYKKMNEEGDLIDKIMLYKNAKLKTIKLKDKNNNLLELLYFKNKPKISKNKIMPYSSGFTHISITVKNLNFLYKNLIKKKIIFNSKPEISSDGSVLMTYCRTPEGAFLELVEELK